MKLTELDVLEAEQWRQGMKLSDEVRGSGISTVQTQWADGISALEERLAIEKKRVLEQAVEILDLREELRRGAA